MSDFFDKSVAAHTKHLFEKLEDDEKAANYVAVWMDKKHPSQFIHRLFLKNLDALAGPGQTWLTVGDMHGSDAHYLQEKGGDVVASDLSDIHLRRMKNIGFIEKYAVENVEKLTFEKETFDFVLCKEAYHHFPRPAIGFYEMLRVAKKGTVILEPLDILSKMPLLLFVKNLLDEVSPALLNRVWRNQYSYETVGNFVFKVSAREFEKMACAINLPAIAFKGFHCDKTNKIGTMVDFKLACKNILSWLKLIPFENLATIVFKEMPDEKMISALKKADYRFLKLPKNPYL